ADFETGVGGRALAQRRRSVGPQRHGRHRRARRGGGDRLQDAVEFGRRRLGAGLGPDTGTGGGGGGHRPVARESARVPATAATTVGWWWSRKRWAGSSSTDLPSLGTSPSSCWAAASASH